MVYEYRQLLYIFNMIFTATTVSANSFSVQIIWTVHGNLDTAASLLEHITHWL
jgi:hypothetical protein